MAKPTPPDRKLTYADFDEMLADVDSLLKNGYQRQGNWSLGQATGHVAEWMRFPIDGFPRPPIFMRALFAVMKATGSLERIKQKILSDGFQPGMPTAPDTVPDAEKLSDQQGVTRLHEAVHRIDNFPGPLKPSPLFGPLDMSLHIRVSLLHAAHHFGYFLPRAG